MVRIVIDGAAVSTVDEQSTEYDTGYVVVEEGRIADVGAGPAPTGPADRHVDARGCLVTPGLINTHHHLYQWATRGLAQQADLFQWLTTLYPVWAGVDAEITHAAATAGLARLALTGCTTAADHHYVFPSGKGDLLAAVVEAAGRVG